MRPDHAAVRFITDFLPSLSAEQELVEREAGLLHYGLDELHSNVVSFVGVAHQIVEYEVEHFLRFFGLEVLHIEGFVSQHMLEYLFSNRSRMLHYFKVHYI